MTEGDLKRRPLSREGSIAGLRLGQPAGAPGGGLEAGLATGGGPAGPAALLLAAAVAAWRGRSRRAPRA